jgi:hypothetical protein
MDTETETWLRAYYKHHNEALVKLLSRYIRMFLGLPDPLARDTDPDLTPETDPSRFS